MVYQMKLLKVHLTMALVGIALMSLATVLLFIGADSPSVNMSINFAFTLVVISNIGAIGAIFGILLAGRP
jgi:hypothetical protein